MMIDLNRLSREMLNTAFDQLRNIKEYTNVDVQDHFAVYRYATDHKFHALVNALDVVQRTSAYGAFYLLFTDWCENAGN